MTNKRTTGVKMALDFYNEEQKTKTKSKISYSTIVTILLLIIATLFISDKVDNHIKEKQFESYSEGIKVGQEQLAMEQTRTGSIVYYKDGNITSSRIIEICKGMEVRE